MRTLTNLKKMAMGATAAAGAMAFGLGMSPASATPVFTITPNALGVTGYTPQVESDINASTDSLVRQTGATTQTEYGWAQVQSFTNNGAGSTHKQTGLDTEDNTGVAVDPNTYGIYLNFKAVVTGISGFGGGAPGVIGAGGFTFTMIADIGDNDVFHSGVAGPGGGILPSVTDTGGNDIVLAVGSSLGGGNAGFQSGTGAPEFSTTSQIILCDGVANQGTFNGATVAATGCGTFNATSYFTSPVPFYDFQFTSATSGSSSDVSDGGTGPVNATINGVVADINFNGAVPEPVSISLFGAGLVGAALYRRRKPKKA